MYRHPFRKSFGLTILYIIIIIGIFVLQFKNESLVTRNIGLLSVSLAQTQNQDGSTSLKNSLTVKFKGITFTADEVTPLMLYSNPLPQQNESQTSSPSLPSSKPAQNKSQESSSNAKSETNAQITQEPLTLLSYEQKTPLSYTFHFTSDVNLTFATTGSDSDAALSIQAELPPQALELYLNYKPTSGFSVTDRTKTKIILSSKNLTYAFTASQIQDKNICLTPVNPSSYYIAYDPSVEFTFASIDSDLIIAQKSTYDTNIANFKKSIISSVEEAISTSQPLSEKSVIAYIAEMAQKNQYNEAIAKIPDSFKKGNKRTYISAPYFNSLNSMYPSLEMHLQNMEEILSNTLQTSSLSIFSIEDFADYINIFSDNQDIDTVLSIPDSIFTMENYSEQLRISQLSGILSTYIKLCQLHSPLSDKLQHAARLCLDLIEQRCVLSDSSLTLMEKDSPVSNSLSLSTGAALIKWGEFNNALEYQHAGYAIINSVLAANTLDAVTMAEAYPYLVSNIYYPHAKILSKEGGECVWAWTCAPSITYTKQGKNANIAVTFPKSSINHAYVCGIPPFTDIEIYGLSFHSDPRFESYNSSGFIYKENSNTLFLRSRHKNETEVIRLTFK